MNPEMLEKLKTMIYQDMMSDWRSAYQDVWAYQENNKPSKETVMATFARYEMVEDGHSKFWQIQTKNANEVEASWGKIGKDAQGSKVYPLDGIDKLIKEKLKKGYALVSHK